ncbi:ribosomal protein S18-alanine N-acetyltransferase [Agromyces archimandritae]|uniref:Ribosomal protein S18-alanine N-acetyltransferase n=1 Tax=Agromyces archimandritae TaxID=2781962 RepID=A0A975FNM7_9MICO|nr:ribosomal protein S18-alanine N-acetyltransferase [Agromyces archimandritae]QTX05454.1 ribosomal protein S18-alanine N-acetyltransferase [Agromyces archimandritae]
MSVLMRIAAASDLDAIMDLEQATFEADAWSQASMLREIEDPNTRYLVAVDDQHGTLFAYGGVLAPPGAPQADIQTIAVAPASRSRGLGRGLMHQLIAEARRRGAQEVFLEVRADNPVAQALYDSLGFERISVRKRYYRGGIDAIIMRLEIPDPETRPAGTVDPGAPRHVGPVGGDRTERRR